MRNGKGRSRGRKSASKRRGTALDYENRSEPLASRRVFAGRLVAHALLAFVLVLVFLGIGALGYHALVGLPWLDATLNAAMILSGMGPVDPVRSDAGKLFATAYALLSGVAFLAVAGLLVAPVAHRLLHALHLEEDGRDGSP